MILQYSFFSTHEVNNISIGSDVKKKQKIISRKKRFLSNSQMDITGKIVLAKPFFPPQIMNTGEKMDHQESKCLHLPLRASVLLSAGIEYFSLTQAQNVEPRRPLSAVFTVCSTDTVGLRCCRSFEDGLVFPGF